MRVIVSSASGSGRQEAKPVGTTSFRQSLLSRTLAGDTVQFGNSNPAAPVDIYTETNPLVAKVIGNVEIAPDVHKITFAVDDRLNWEPGQAIKVNSKKPNNA